jgi:hypothetical protein
LPVISYKEKYMGFEQVAAKLMSVFTHQPPVAEYQPPQVEYEANPTPRSPWDVMQGDSERDRILTNMMHESFNPRYVDASGLLPIPDSGGRWYAEPIDTPDGKQSSIWLDPAKWLSTLNEFAALADAFNEEGISFRVNHHSVDKQNEYIMITPVEIDRSGFGRNTNITFGLSVSGKVDIGNPQVGFHDLGHLNYKRSQQDAIASLKETLFGFNR